MPAVLAFARHRPAEATNPDEARGGRGPKKGKKNSPSRLRFRPPSPGTFGFRLRPSGAASTYSRSVLGARGKVVPLQPVRKGTGTAIPAICGEFHEDSAI